MAEGVVVAAVREVRIEGTVFDAVEFVQKSADGGRGAVHVASDVDLDAVAGGDHNSFVDAVDGCELRQCAGQGLDREGDLFAQLDRSVRVVHADADEAAAHGATGSLSVGRFFAPS